MNAFFRTLIMTVVAFVAITAMTAADAVAQDGYRIRPGDTLTIEVLQDPSLNRQVLVTPDGRFSFPFAGSLDAANFTTDQIAQRLSGAIASNFATAPNVFVSIASLREVPRATGGPAAIPTITVYFMGEVGDPGERAVAPGTTFLQGLSQSGGLTTFAAERRIQLRRTDPTTLVETVVTINYRALQRGARLSQNVVLAEGDVILVPERGLFE